MTTKIVGFQSGHDVAYCIMENGVPILHEELERFTRIKMELGDGLKFFFSRQKDYQDIKYFTFGNWGGRGGKRHRITGDSKSDAEMKEIIVKNNGKYYEFGHHLSHAANAFFTSNFNKSLIITMDGGGCENDSLCTAFALYEGNGNKISDPVSYPKINLGTTWYELTKYVFGLSVRAPKGDQAGTVMAMSTLGEPKYLNLIKEYKTNIQKLKLIADKSEQEKFNIAASLQEYTEETFKKTVSEFIKNHQNLCLSGGVSLNCVMLGKIRTWFPQIKNIFCDPVPYDAGLALGSARYLWHHVLGNPRIEDHTKNQSPYLGVTYSKEDVLKALESFGGRIQVLKTTDEQVLEKINNQKIVSVFGGGSESGRRALGNRSILADPRNPEMKKIINEKIKHRQWFRPLAPSILEEKVSEWFENPIPSPYMSFALKFKEDKKKFVPAVAHFDGTGRLQTISKKLNPWFHDFVSKWETLSGVPILVNTSFNDSEPIVETPNDALNCFLKTGLDFLYFFDYGILVSKL
jgi:carbamoyltransferase